MSEEDDLGGEFIAVDINGSCYSLVSCLAMDSLQIYCGASADFASLNNFENVTSTDGDVITVQLPPATGQEYIPLYSEWQYWRWLHPLQIQSNGREVW